MIHGVIIDGINTLEEYGLILCADLKIGRAKLKENRVDIPGGDGSLNMSYSPQGYPVYSDRTISFSLFKALKENERDQLVSELCNAWNGKEVSLVLPNDLTHYWKGTLEIGDISGYNSGKIPVSMTAFPYKLKLQETTVNRTGSGTITLANEKMPVVPEIYTTRAATLAWDSFSISISAGSNVVPQLVLQQGETEITITTTGTITFTYREGSL